MYTDPTYFTNLAFGSQSHWIQPWRSYLETVPASTFLDGIGINFNIGSSNPEPIAQMLADHSVRQARVEIGWNNLSYDDDTMLIDYRAEQLRSQLLALKQNGIRPLILLNANDGEPVPVQHFERTILNGAEAGDIQVQLNDVSGLRVGYSGLSNLSKSIAAEALITDINGNTVTLSKPLPDDLAIGADVKVTTLKYRPFSLIGTEDYNATLTGWKNYVSTVTDFVIETLETTHSADKGFDVEVWNELSFGSDFLYINNYYEQDLYDGDRLNYNEDSIWGALIQATTDVVNADPDRFSGVQFSDGFANTVPWVASSTTPSRFDAISKHPYANRKTYPQDEDKNTPLNALGQPDGSFTPSYTARFPEYFATALQTETLVRDIGPITSDIYGTLHGRYARTQNGEIQPTSVWITEFNISPVEDDPTISADRAFEIKTKTALRSLSFYLNKGVTELYLYGVSGGDTGLGTVKESFLQYAEQDDAVYQPDNATFSSPVLEAISNLAQQFSQQLDPNLTQTRSLAVTSITDTHDHYQFIGDGTLEHPNLYNRDVFAFLPYQVNAQRFVIPYYVMTRDVLQDLTPEAYTLEIAGLNGIGATISVYDPIGDRMIPVTILNQSTQSLTLELTATDSPYLLIVQEATASSAADPLPSLDSTSVVSDSIAVSDSIVISDLQQSLEPPANQSNTVSDSIVVSDLQQSLEPPANQSNLDSLVPESNAPIADSAPTRPQEQARLLRRFQRNLHVQEKRKIRKIKSFRPFYDDYWQGAFAENGSNNFSDTTQSSRNRRQKRVRFV